MHKDVLQLEKGMHIPVLQSQYSIILSFLHTRKNKYFPSVEVKN